MAYRNQELLVTIIQTSALYSKVKVLIQVIISEGPTDWNKLLTGNVIVISRRLPVDI